MGLISAEVETSAGVLKKQTSGLFSCREKTVTLTALTKTAEDSFFIFYFGFLLRFCEMWIPLFNIDTVSLENTST